jgi:Coenzyme PQQ synthesis protein D (PqqD)
MCLRLRDADLEWREIDDEIVVLDAREASYLALRGSGAVLWRLLAQGASSEALAAALVERYGIEQPQANTDVEAFLSSLTQHGLLA